jgi:hypothetical protein
MPYTGQLLGGPYDKAIITSRTTNIAVRMTVELSPNGSKFLELKVFGEYTWQVKGEFFLWNEIQRTPLNNSRKGSNA